MTPTKLQADNEIKSCQPVNPPPNQQLPVFIYLYFVLQWHLHTPQSTSRKVQQIIFSHDWNDPSLSNCLIVFRLSRDALNDGLFSCGVFLIFGWWLELFKWNFLVNACCIFYGDVVVD